jgi:methylthioribulose-1-phosphate dehydratase
VSTWDEVAGALADLSRVAYSRGWIPGTSGNFSAVVQRNPLELAITPSSIDKARLGAGDVVRIDADGKGMSGSMPPSAEAPIHLAIARVRGVGAVGHTHSRASTLVSETHASGVSIQGYELLKGLSGVRTHDHREWLPIIENTQDWSAHAASIEEMLLNNPSAHGFLIRRHGLYTWGSDPGEVLRHLEVIEFLLDILVAKLVPDHG